MLDYNFYKNIPNLREIIKNKSINRDTLFNLFENNFSDLPYIDQIETTNFCNMKCKMCPRFNHMTRDLKIMDNQLFYKIIDELVEIEKEKINRGITKKKFENDNNNNLVWDGYLFDIFDLRLHHFGAPFLDPHLANRVEYIKSKKTFGTQLSETITNITIDKSIELFKKGLNRIIIAIDGTNKEEFEYNRGVKIKFDMEIQKLHKIIDIKNKNNYKTQIDIQIIDLISTNITKFKDYWKNVKGVNILFKSFFPYPDIDLNIGNLDKSDFYSECTFPYSGLVILSNGLIVSCCADYNGENIIGDLKSESLYNIWKSENFKNFRKKFVYNFFEKNSLCNRCGYYPFNSK